MSTHVPALQKKIWKRLKMFIHFYKISMKD